VNVGRCIYGDFRYYAIGAASARSRSARCSTSSSRRQGASVSGLHRARTLFADTIDGPVRVLRQGGLPSQPLLIIDVGDEAEKTCIHSG